MPLETQAQFARRLGVNRSTVNRHIAAGRVVVVGKRIDVEPSLARLAQVTGTRPDVAARHAAARGPVESPPQPQAPSPAYALEEGPDGASGERAHYKALAMQFENDQIKLEMALRRGVRLPLADVKREAAALGAVLRAALERLVDQTAPRLAVMTATPARAALIHAELRQVRRTLRGEFPRALRRLREAARGNKGPKS